MKDTNFIIVSAIFVLILVSLLTNYNGTTDVNEYTSVAKFFAGEYNAKVRSAHSLTYGFINAPLLKISENFYNMKLISLILIIIIIFSIYFISGKDKKALILISISPIIFYMGPWINPIQLSSLLFLWGFFFIRKFELNPKNIYLIYSGILIGLSWVFWNTVLFILPFFVICFFFNKRFSQLILFSLALLAGLLPLLIFDYYYFTTPFYSIFRHLMANVSTFLYGRIYSGIDNQVSISAYIAFFIMLPLFGYTFFKKQFFKENNSVIIFITLVILFFLTNPQIRYLLFIWPILILTLSKSLNDKQLKIQIILFIIISLIVITPYVIQLKYSTNSEELTNLLINFGNWKLYNDPNKSINQEIIEIAKEYPNSTFLVGNNADDYAYLANIYWGKDIKEFVSIQDYELYFKNETSLFKKRFEPKPIIPDRRIIWIEGGISKNPNDNTNYGNITLAISINEPLNEPGFRLIKKYNILYLSEKV